MCSGNIHSILQQMEKLVKPEFVKVEIDDLMDPTRVNHEDTEVTEHTGWCPLLDHIS